MENESTEATPKAVTPPVSLLLPGSGEDTDKSTTITTKAETAKAIPPAVSPPRESTSGSGEEITLVIKTVPPTDSTNNSKKEGEFTTTSSSSTTTSEYTTKEETTETVDGDTSSAQKETPSSTGSEDDVSLPTLPLSSNENTLPSSRGEEPTNTNENVYSSELLVIEKESSSSLSSPDPVRKGLSQDALFSQSFARCNEQMEREKPVKQWSSASKNDEEISMAPSEAPSEEIDAESARRRVSSHMGKKARVTLNDGGVVTGTLVGCSRNKSLYLVKLKVVKASPLLEGLQAEQEQDRSRNNDECNGESTSNEQKLNKLYEVQRSVWTKVEVDESVTQFMKFK